MSNYSIKSNDFNIEIEDVKAPLDSRNLEFYQVYLINLNLSDLKFN